MQLIRKLFTHEDRKFYHMHKVVGSICLLNFIKHLSSALVYGSCFFNYSYSYSYLLLLFIHASLHVTSFEFILSNRRNLSYNIIWPEMRWHSLLFAYRSLLIMLLFRYENEIRVVFGLSRYLVVIGTMVSADAVSYALPQKKDEKELKTMRDNPYPKGTSEYVIKAINLFYSISQVFATLHMLFAPTPDYIYLTLIPIQTAPFGMTLQRKGIITQFGWHAFYIFAILTNYIYSAINIYEPVMSWTFMIFFAVCRFKLNMNKYVLWTIIFFVKYFYL